MSSENTKRFCAQQRGKLAEANKIVYNIEDLNLLNDNAAVENEMEHLIETCQSAALASRQVFANGFSTEKYQAEIQKISDEVFHITVEITPEGWVRITMPLLLQKKLKTSQWFLREPLNYALERFFFDYQKKNGGKEFRIEHALLAYIYHYDRNNPKKRLRDLDAYEEKGVTDSIACFTMPDDDCRHCSRFSASMPSDRDFTEIFVIPNNDTIKWLQKQSENPDFLA